jgi:hypothetical protein
MKRWLLLLLLAGCGGFQVVPEEDVVEQADLGEHGHHHHQ